MADPIVSTVVLGPPTVSNIAQYRTGKISFFLLRNPSILLVVFGMIMMLVSLLGAKKITVPFLKAGIDFNLDKPLRIPSFIVGALCVGAGIYLYVVGIN